MDGGVVKSLILSLPLSSSWPPPLLVLPRIVLQSGSGGIVKSRVILGCFLNYQYVFGYFTTDDMNSTFIPVFLLTPAAS